MDLLLNSPSQQVVMKTSSEVIENVTHGQWNLGLQKQVHPPLCLYPSITTDKVVSDGESLV